VSNLDSRFNAIMLILQLDVFSEQIFENANPAAHSRIGVSQTFHQSAGWSAALTAIAYK